MSAGAILSWRRRAVRLGAVLALGIGALVSHAADPPVLRSADEVLVIDRAVRDGRAVTLPESVSASTDGAGIEARWVLEFATPAGRSGFGLYLSGVRGHVRIVLNDQPLLDTITDPPGPTPRAISRLRLVDLPPYLLRSGTNRVEITLRNASEVSLSRVTLGSQQALRDLRDRKAVLMGYGPLLVAALIFCLGLSVLLIWLRRPHDTIYGWFALASLTWGVHTAWGVSPRTLLPPAHFYVWWGSMYFLLVVSLAIFAVRFAGYAWPRVERVLLWAAAAMPLLYYAAQALDRLSPVDIAVRLGMVLIAFGALAAVARSAWRRRSVESLLLMMAGVAAAGLGLRDWLVFTFDADNLPVQLTPYAGLPFVALLAWILIDRFVRTNESLERLNRELEARVQDKSRELVSALDHMRAARDWAERANRSKTGFLAAASHDLRQPIHALGLYMGALRQRSADPVAREIVERMDHSVGALDSLLDSLLDISRIDAGALVPRPAAFDLAALIHRLADEFAADAAERGLRLSTRIGGAGGARAWSDPSLVERMLRNLIANAVKYTRRGGVLVTCRARHDAAGAPQWQVQVWDTGPGIAPEEQERVFDEFYQAGNPERDRRAGLGLGLSIVRRLAELLKLPLALHSVPGRGTRFSVVLPATEAPAAKPAAPAEAAPLHGLQVAVIEDDAEVRAAMRALLTGWGCEVRDGSDADELLRRGAGAAQAVVADLRLRGGRDGIAEAGRLRAAWGTAVPVLLVSGDTAPERVQLMERSGLPWLAKPVAAARLRAWLAQVRSGAPAPEQEETPS